MQTVEPTFAAPPLRYLALEHRFVAERVVLGALRHLLPAARGDGHPVLVLPGLGATDRSTAAARAAWARQGYAVEGWDQGRHPIWTRAFVSQVEQHLLDVTARRGQPVSLVGVSAGGILARELARVHPDAVRQVITVVSPFRHRDGDDNRIARVLSVLRPSGAPDHYQALPREDDREPLGMPVTSIWSRSDGFVDWRSCVETPGPRSENIEVRSSHLGAATNVGVVVAVAERLTVHPDAWRPFSPPPGTGRLFPRVPASARTAP